MEENFRTVFKIILGINCADLLFTLIKRVWNSRIGKTVGKFYHMVFFLSEHFLLPKEPASNTQMQNMKDSKFTYYASVQRDE